MELAQTALIGAGALSAWLILAGATALVAGRMIHERDVHDRPAARTLRTTRSHAGRR